MSIAVVAESADALDAGNCAVSGDWNVLKRQRRERLVEATEDLVLKSFDIDLAELRLAVAGDKFIQTDERHVDLGVPSNPLESSVGLDIVHPGIGKG